MTASFKFNNKKEYLILKIRYSFCVQNKRKQNHRQHQWHPYIVKVGKKNVLHDVFIIVGKSERPWSRKRELNVCISAINIIRIVRGYAVDIVNLKIGAVS